MIHSSTPFNFSASAEDFGVLPRIAHGVELGYCPREYTASSCQDPAPGYYRKRKPNFLDSKDILDLVGWAEPCECNGMADECDKETGVCIVRIARSIYIMFSSSLDIVLF